MKNRLLTDGAARHGWIIAALIPLASHANLPVVVEPGECPLCDQFPVATNKDGRVLFRMSAAFTGGGWLPEGFVVKDPPDGVQEANGAWRADLISIQHAYSASFDLDLAPKVNPITALFDSDTFDNPPFLGGERRLTDDLASRLAGARLEDFNYTVSEPDWPLGYKFGFDRPDAYFHGPGETPRTYYVDPSLFDGRPEPTEAEVAQLASLRRFVMTCNVGPNLLTGLPHPDNVVAVGQELPADAPESTVVASNGGNVRMITGPLAVFWNTITAPPSLSWSREADAIVVTYADGTLETSETMAPGSWVPVNQPSPARLITGAPRQFVRVRQ